MPANNRWDLIRGLKGSNNEIKGKIYGPHHCASITVQVPAS